MGRRQQRGKPGDLPFVIHLNQSFRVKGDVKRYFRFISLTLPGLIVFTLIINAMRIMLFVGVLSSGICLRAYAQDSTATLLREVVVSASRSEQAIIETPRSVTVITHETIRNSVYQSVGELLNTQSGLFIVGANQTPGTNQNIFMRGANSNQVAVLVDGVRVTDPSSPNAAIDFSEISLANVERIEIIRGSHSTLFGGAAVGGVINIITKDHAAGGVHGDVAWQGGIFGRNAWSSAETINVGIGTSSGLYATGALYRQDVNGLDATEKNVPSFTSDEDDFRKTDASLKLGFRDERWNASASFRNASQYTEIDDGAFTDDDNSYLRFDRQLGQYSLRYKMPTSLELQILGSISNSERFFEDDSSRVSADTWDHTFTKGSYRGKLQTHELQITYRKGPFSGIVGSGVYAENMSFDNYIIVNDPFFTYESRTNYDSIDTRTSTVFLFGRAGYALKNFDLSAGARMSAHSEAGNFATFEVSPSFTVENFLLYASVATAFNPPSLYQLFDPVKDFNSFASRGNIELEPEKSLSLEFGIKKQFPSGAHATVSAYQTTVTNSIEYVYLWDGAHIIDDLDFSHFRGDRYINVGEQEVRGIEAETLVPISSQFTLSGNVSLLETKVRTSPDDVDERLTGGHHVQLYNLGRFVENGFEGSSIARRPSLTVFSGVAWKPVRGFSVDVGYRITGNRFDARYDDSLGPFGALTLDDVAAYHLVDLGMDWAPMKSLTLHARVENLLDENYREVLGFRTRGRGVYLKVVAMF